MGVRLPSVASTAIQNATITANTETVIAIITGIALPFDGAQVILLWRWSITTAVTTTSFNTRLRRGTTTADTQVNVSDLMVPTANQQNATGGAYLDNPGIRAGLSYALTVQSAGAGANHTVQDVALIAIVL